MPNKPTYIDLFAGCGGLSLGLHLAGWKGLFAIEKNAMAFETLKRNLIEKKPHFDWPSWLAAESHDIDEILRTNKEELGKLKDSVHLVAGGPPCCGFSTAGLRREADERNHLVDSYLRFVKIVRPKAILFENVRGFTMPFRAKAEAGVTYSRLIIEKLKKLGYDDARGELIDMSRYGVPQRRTRFILCATLTSKAGSFFRLIEENRLPFLASKGLPRMVSTRAALSDLKRSAGVVASPDSSNFEAGVYGRAANPFQRLMRGGAPEEGPVDSHRFARHTPETIQVFENLLENAPRNRTIIGEARTSYGLKKRSVTVMDPCKPCPTITTIPDDYIHYIEPRVATVRESARLQSFPDWYEFRGVYTTGGKQRVAQTPRYTQVGNAIPPLFAELAGSVLKELLKT